MDRYSWLSTQFEPAIGMVKRGDGPYVLYTDHIAALTERDKEIERLTEELDSHSWEISPAMAQQRIDKLWAENKRLERDILMLVRLCLSNGIISRGLACEHLGCAREDLDDVIKEDSDGRGEETA
jgi:hypothetical protein